MDSEIFSAVIVIIATLVFIYLYGVAKKKLIQNQQKNTEDMYSLLSSKIYPIVNTHIAQLSIQRKKSVYTDPYGKEDLSNWYDKEISYFLASYVYPYLTNVEKYFFAEYQQGIFDLIDNEVKLYDKTSNKKAKSLTFNKNMSGRDFEDYCHQKLLNEGWKVQITKNTGDQGVDLIIEKDNRKIGIQCKKYAKPIGNKAVQEIKAGLNYYNLNEGAVICSSSYTKSAIELANMNDIKLLHYLETDKL